jgi:hypothetical protein
LEVLRVAAERRPSVGRRKFALFEGDPFHPSLALKAKGVVWTADVGRSYRAIAHRDGNDFHWFWIGTHEAYNKLLSRIK